VAKRKQHYKYRPQKEYPKGLPWHKELIRKLEKFNKFLFLRVLGKILSIRPISGPIALNDVSSVLIIRYDALGDMIVTTPLWRILKHAKPSITIGVAGSFKNLDLLRADKDIDYLYDYSASSLIDFFRISKKTRKKEWDIVLMGNFNQKTRNAIISRLASPHGITATVGSSNIEGHQKLFSRLVSLPLPMNEMPMTLQLQHLLRSVISIPDVTDERPSIMIDDKTETATKNAVHHILEEMHRNKYIILNTDAPGFKKWSMENNISLAEFISEKYPQFVILLTSLPENKASIMAILAKREIPGIRYFSTPDIHVMTAVIRYSSLVITPDTSIVHLASAENKPIIAFYLAINEWLPYKSDCSIILPKKGEAISTITLSVAEEAVKVMLGEKKEDQPITRIVRCENPDSIEIRHN
jgi:ADP-heptose:LPS heptosyltransferase